MRKDKNGFTETDYENKAFLEMQAWQREMLRKPSVTEKVTKNMQRKVNSLIPEKIHAGITVAFREMVKSFLSGTKLINELPLENGTLEEREALLERKIQNYKKAAAAEGVVTGAGGFLMSLADFPLWLSLKIRMLAAITAVYGHDINDLRERLFLLYIFQLCFSGSEHRKSVFLKIRDFEALEKQLPEKVNELDWQSFQQEYRDYLDIAKLLQMIPGVGAIVGGAVNHSLTAKLAKTAMNAYRMRWFERKLPETFYQ